MSVSLDSLSLLLLCSTLRSNPDPDLTPLSLREWNLLARRLQSAGLRPGALLGLNPGEMSAQLVLSLVEADRLHRLLEGRNDLSKELERWAALGIYPLTRADADYPVRFRQRLKESAPVVLFYAGEKALLGQPGVAVVGSRVLDETGQECAAFVGNACGLSGLVLYSGGAHGVDKISMNAALDARGSTVGLLADSLEKASRNAEWRSALRRCDLCLVSQYSPNSSFSVGAAMGRNRLIYTLADFAIIVASDAEKGGTWAGATQALKTGWTPVFVLEHLAMPQGNRLLLQKGALPFPHPFPEHFSKLHSWLETQARQARQNPTQPGLF